MAVNNSKLSDLMKSFAGRPVLRVMGHIIAVHDKALAAFGITTRQMNLLATCMETSDCTPAELARLNGIEVSSVTRMVDRLVEKGFLTRTHSEEDRRQVNLSVTGKGAQLLDRALPLAAQNSRRIWHGITEKEKAVLRGIVEKLNQNLEEMGPKKNESGKLNESKVEIGT